ncbi:hypothetical protein G3I59_14010 [Amycolatopsis rubida]|uniref:Uncharacterized protein n=1 Tax=Amycolatopsis rubida TaxID=112413 RepID=A0ABX0BMI2_9PSEU|nr:MULTISPECIES: hypothetical protein [Amycolatopsis]MYW91686.1 hypothetical protein [Amycolatopsis rubida]NEC56670.1 hypothetical protein [Amycolatopsis rubida]OAP20439.1 hypothetical protein A4R44_08863 [Amycolatopsis sp. M39]
MSTQEIPPALRGKYRPVRLGIDVGTYATGYAWTILDPDGGNGQREIT